MVNIKDSSHFAGLSSFGGCPRISSMSTQDHPAGVSMQQKVVGEDLSIIRGQILVQTANTGQALFKAQPPGLNSYSIID